jgi:hypothetical protein
MEIAEHIEAVRREGESLADGAERAGLDAAVPPCKPWQVRDLVRHTGHVHRWAARHLIERPERIIGQPGEADSPADRPTRNSQAGTARDMPHWCGH